MSNVEKMGVGMDVGVRTVQLFPQGYDGILIVKGTNKIPNGMKGPIVFDKDNNPVAFSRINAESTVYVNDSELSVTELKLTDKYVSFTDKDNLEVTIKNPQMEIVEGNVDVINVNNNKIIDAIVGKMSDMYWSPKYICQVDNNYNITKLSLIANIINNNPKLTAVKTIIFSLLALTDYQTNSINTVSYNDVSESSNMSRSSLPSSSQRKSMALSSNSMDFSSGNDGLQDVQQSDSDYSYSITGDYTLNQHTVIPLWTSKLDNEEVGYIFVSPNSSSSRQLDKMFSGYDIDIDPKLYLPPGTVMLMKTGPIIYKEVSMPRAIANNIRLIVTNIPSVTVMSNNTFKNEGNLQVVTLQYTIQNNNDYDIITKIVMPVGQINVLKFGTDQQQKPKHDLARRELIWTLTSKANTESTLTTDFIIGNQ